ncbi:hypothetical protein LKL35_32320 [Streptomyces sp. ET3-23]|uniref:hypothetical protein n=1 Tax=Streptomyces sp. ET3-23 TaxID=2885643 RepID=UPI001D102684|nr:hypothetical protein [Streptomyces sp. ET3-23]MCC2280076.1 hypothetical protein [Streptomyces sp. ET3-23]
MGSLLEELERREAETRARVEELREQVEELNRQLAAEEERLTRLRITRETVDEVLAEAGAEAAPQERDGGGPVGQKAAGASVPGTDAVIGVQTVPSWRPGLETSVLPAAYQDLLEVLGDAGGPLRAKQIAVGIGLGSENLSKVEGVRSKLKRLVMRGWLTENTPGVFALRPDSGNEP